MTETTVKKTRSPKSQTKILFDKICKEYNFDREEKISEFLNEFNKKYSVSGELIPSKLAAHTKSDAQLEAEKNIFE